MAIIVIRMGQCALVCHPHFSKVNHHFPWREDELELDLFPQSFHPLIPFPHYSKTLYITVRQQVSPSAQLLWDCSFLTMLSAELFLTATWCYWHIIQKCATEKKTPCWICLGSLVFRREVLLKTSANTLFSCVRSLNWYLPFLSLPTFSNSSFFQLSL